MTAPDDPFAILDLEPTLDAAALKRAYFVAIARTPPHKDADAFRRVRAAYDALRAPGGLATAFLLAPLATEAAAAPYRARYDARIDAAAEVDAADVEPPRVDEIVAVVSGSTLAELLEGAR